MPSFINTINPTPFGFFNSDVTFQQEADSMVTFVKRKLGDDVLSVELTRKEIWACFEEACCEYSKQIHELKIISELANVMGMPTGSIDLTNKLPRQTLEFLIRQAEPYGAYAGIGGTFDTTLGYFDLESGTQDYNLYTQFKNMSGTILYNTLPTGSRGAIRVLELFHFDPVAAQGFMLNASNMTNFLSNNFNYESYVNSTVFYTLPIFEDVLRRGMLNMAARVRRSNYSYQIMGGNVRIYPTPMVEQQLGKLFARVYAGPINALASTSFQDDTIYGISGPSNIPLGNLPFATITQPGRQWIRQYTLALATILLGLIRSKFQTVPIPNAELTLNGQMLVTDGREDKDKLTTQLKEFLAQLTNLALMEQQSKLAAAVQAQLKFLPIPNGQAITIG